MPAMSDSLKPTLPEELVKKAREELNEKLETRESDIKIFREMVEGINDMEVPTDDANLLRFLRARKFNFIRALKLLKRYYQFRIKHHALYVNFYPSAVRHVFQDDSKMMLLPQTDPNGCKIFVLRIGYWKPEECSFDDLFRAFAMCMEAAIMEESIQITGIIAVIDMENIGFHQLKHLHPNNLRKQISLVQDSFPGRFKGFHLIRQPYVFNLVYTIIKPFLIEKLRHRIFFHGWDLETLHSHVPVDILPAEFGGSQPPLDNSEFLESLLDLNEAFVEAGKIVQKKPT